MRCFAVWICEASVGACSTHLQSSTRKGGTLSLARRTIIYVLVRARLWVMCTLCFKGLPLPSVRLWLPLTTANAHSTSSAKKLPWMMRLKGAHLMTQDYKFHKQLSKQKGVFVYDLFNLPSLPLIPLTVYCVSVLAIGNWQLMGHMWRYESQRVDFVEFWV